MENVKKTVLDPINKFGIILTSPNTRNKVYIKCTHEVTTDDINRHRRNFARSAGISLKSIIVEHYTPTVLHAIGEPALIKPWGDGREEQWWYQGHRYRNVFYKEDGSVYSDVNYIEMLPKETKEKIQTAATA